MLVDANEIGDRIFKLVAPCPAGPAGVKMRPDKLPLVRGKFAVNVKEQLLVGKV
jgi:hypothetical protein